MLLRPHHLLCMRFFTGKGYDENFVANMQSIIKALTENPETEVLIVMSGDVICERCPNLADGICSSDEKVRRYDKSVIKLCGLDDGKQYPVSELKRFVNDKILAKNILADICGDCGWFEICGSVE